MSCSKTSFVLKIPKSENDSQIVETVNMKQYEKEQALLDDVKLDRCTSWIRDQSKFINSYDKIVDDSKVIAENNKLIIDSVKPGEKRKFESLESDSNENNTDSDAAPKAKRLFYKRPEILPMECEWKHCSFNVNKYETFLKHVKSHMHQLPIKNIGESGGVYLCAWDICDFQTSDDKAIVRHVNFHGYHTYLKAIGLITRERLNYPRCVQDSSNRNTIPEYAEAFTCRWEDCNDIFQCMQIFSDHVISHVNTLKSLKKKKVSSICGWRGCKAVRRSLLDLAFHTRTHTGRRELACPHCGATFVNATKYEDHCRRQIPLDMQTFKCVECHKCYATEQLLKDHMRLHINYYKCSLCEMTYPTPAMVSKHIRSKHLNIKTYQCHLCDKSVINKKGLERHFRTHQKENSFKCTEKNCEQSYRCPMALKRHLLNVHGDGVPLKYCCHNCDARFTIGNDLTKHLKGVHGFHWPAGHSRFTYREGVDGLFRLQTTRYECLDVNEQMTDTATKLKLADPKANNYKLAQINPTASDQATSFIIFGANETPNLDQYKSKTKVKPEIVKSEIKQGRTKRTSSKKLCVKSEKELFKNNTDSIINDDLSQTDSNLTSIEDFSVMKRYIKQTKPVVITIDDIDADGKVIKSEVLNSELIVCDSNLTE